MSFLVKYGFINGSIRDGPNRLTCNWKNGKPIGSVKIETKKYIFLGNYLLNNENIHGKILYNNGDEYEGIILRENDKYYMNGEGKLTKKNIKLL